MKFLKKWYTKDTSRHDQFREVEVDLLSSTEPEHGTRERLTFLQDNYEYYEKYGKEKLARMIQMLRSQLESSQLSELDTARFRGSILSYRTMMRYYEAMPSEIDNIVTQGKNLEKTAYNINNFDK